MEQSLKDILNGKHVPAQYLNQLPEEDPLPITKWNICYICAAVLFDEEDKVLLVQEAKKSCYGQWYLPAGRLEPRETLIDGTKREVLEESGLECDLSSLISVELNGTWIRVTFTGKITGGKLKSLNEKDTESLQAKFFHQDELPQDIRSTKKRSDNNISIAQGGSCVLRSKDILSLIEIGRNYRKEMNYDACLPVIHPHKYVSNRFVIIDKSTPSGTLHILASTIGDSPQLPTRLCSIWKRTNIFSNVACILSEAFSMSQSDVSYKIYGLLGVEHRGTEENEDGNCSTLLVSLDLGEENELPHIKSTEYKWCPVVCPELQMRLINGCYRKIVPIL